MTPALDPSFIPLINLPLGEFAVPAPRTGSIEAYSGYGQSAADGQEIHQRVQRRRAKSDPSYQAEVAVSALFERGGYRFQVNGRSRRLPPRSSVPDRCCRLNHCRENGSITPCAKGR